MCVCVCVCVCMRARVCRVQQSIVQTLLAVDERDGQRWAEMMPMQIRDDDADKMLVIRCGRCADWLSHAGVPAPGASGLVRWTAGLRAGCGIGKARAVGLQQVFLRLRTWAAQLRVPNRGASTASGTRAPRACAILETSHGCCLARPRLHVSPVPARVLRRCSVGAIDDGAGLSTTPPLLLDTTPRLSA